MWRYKIKELVSKQLDSSVLPSHAWPGGYPLFYVDEENCIVCPSCAQKDKDDEYRVIVEYEVNWEDTMLICEECNEHIESAYADDIDEFGDQPEWNDMHMSDDD